MLQNCNVCSFTDSIKIYEVKKTLLKFPLEGLMAMKEVFSGETLFGPYVPYHSPML